MSVAAAVSWGIFRHIVEALPNPHLQNLHPQRHVMSVARRAIFAVIARDLEAQEVRAKVNRCNLLELLRAPEYQHH